RDRTVTGVQTCALPISVRLVEVLIADRGGVFGKLPLVAGNRVEQRLVDADEARRHADRCGERAHLVAVAPPQKRSGPLECLANEIGRASCRERGREGGW